MIYGVTPAPSTELSVLAGERGVNQNEDNQQQMLLIPGLGLMIKANEKIKFKLLALEMNLNVQLGK